MSFLQLMVYEWRLVRRERVLWILVLLVAGLGLYAGSSGARFARAQEQTISELREDEARRLDSLRNVVVRLEAGEAVDFPSFADPRNPGGRGFGVYSVLPPGPLAPLAIGQRDVQPFWALISTRTKQTFFVNDEIENPAVLVAGRLDLAFLILVLYPLVILALTFDVVAGERERGTLALLLAQPVDPRRVLTAKLAARALVALVLTLALTFLAAVATGVPLTEVTALTRLATWGGVILLYGAFWFAVALVVNARRMSSAASAVTLLAVWLAVVVVLPAIAAAAVTVTHPAPSRIALTTKLREVTDAVAANRQEAMAMFLMDHPGFAVEGGAGAPDPVLMSVAMQEAAERTMAAEYAAFDAALDAQRRAAERFRFISPALIVQSALLELAGSGETRFRRYEQQFDDFHAAWRELFFGRMLTRHRLTAEDYSTIPRFTFAEESLTAILGRLLPGLLVLLGLTFLLTVAARRGLRLAARSA